MSDARKFRLKQSLAPQRAFVGRISISERSVRPRIHRSRIICEFLQGAPPTALRLWLARLIPFFQIACCLLKGVKSFNGSCLPTGNDASDKQSKARDDRAVCDRNRVKVRNRSSKTSIHTDTEQKKEPATGRYYQADNRQRVLEHSDSPNLRVARRPLAQMLHPAKRLVAFYKQILRIAF